MSSSGELVARGKAETVRINVPMPLKVRVLTGLLLPAIVGAVIAGMLAIAWTLAGHDPAVSSATFTPLLKTGSNGWTTSMDLNADASQRWLLQQEKLASGERVIASAAESLGVSRSALSKAVNIATTGENDGSLVVTATGVGTVDAQQTVQSVLRAYALVRLTSDRAALLSRAQELLHLTKGTVGTGSAQVGGSPNPLLQTAAELQASVPLGDGDVMTILSPPSAPKSTRVNAQLTLLASALAFSLLAGYRLLAWRYTDRVHDAWRYSMVTGQSSVELALKKTGEAITANGDAVEGIRLAMLPSEVGVREMVWTADDVSGRTTAMALARPGEAVSDKVDGDIGSKDCALISCGYVHNGGNVAERRLLVASTAAPVSRVRKMADRYGAELVAVVDRKWF
jgi:hypothetical protein